MVILGLVSKPEYNGLPAVVKAVPRAPGDAGGAPARVAVDVQINSKGKAKVLKTLSVKERNLRRTCLLRSNNQRKRAINTHKLALLLPALVDTLMDVLRDWELLLRIADFLLDCIQPIVFSGYRGGCVDTVYARTDNRGWWEPTTMTPSRIDCAVVVYARGTKALFAGGACEWAIDRLKETPSCQEYARGHGWAASLPTSTDGLLRLSS